MDKGLTHIYTGDGKGKTTAAVGITVRARGRGLSAVFAQFFKEADPDNEIGQLQRLGVTTLVFDAVKSPLFNPGIDRELIRQEASGCLERLSDLLAPGDVDLLVIDEFICLVAEGVITEDEAIAFLRKKPSTTELVLTGAGATDRIIGQADYVTFMMNIKHPFRSRLEARSGIEY